MSNVALEWILTDSDAPKEIKQLALQTLLGNVVVMGFSLNHAQDDEIKQEVTNQRKIMAIKLFRQFTGAGLKEAKDAIEKHYM